MKLSIHDINTASFEQWKEWENQTIFDIADIERRIESFYEGDSAPLILKEKTKKALRHNQRNLRLLQTLIRREQHERDKIDRLIEKEDAEAAKNERVEKHIKMVNDAIRAKEERIRKRNEFENQRQIRLVKELRKIVTHEQFLACCEIVEKEMPNS